MFHIMGCVVAEAIPCGVKVVGSVFKSHDGIVNGGCIYSETPHCFLPVSRHRTQQATSPGQRPEPCGYAMKTVSELKLHSKSDFLSPICGLTILAETYINNGLLAGICLPIEFTSQVEPFIINGQHILGSIKRPCFTGLPT